MDYQPPRILQPFGELGGHMGMGAALVFEAAITLEEEAEEVWVEAAAPVRARTTTKARIMFCMMYTPKVVFLSVDFAGQTR
jgi:hypothetical protein